MIIETATGSTYEIDLPGKRIRRLGGKREPTQRQGVDGRWQPYFDITEIDVGLNVVVTWSYDDTIKLSKTTITSSVVKVTE